MTLEKSKQYFEAIHKKENVTSVPWAAMLSLPWQKKKSKKVYLSATPTLTHTDVLIAKYIEKI